jgi:hypothetical protein
MFQSADQYQIQQRSLLTKTLVDYKQELEKAKDIEKREHKTQQSRDDASTIQHLKTLKAIPFHVLFSLSMSRSSSQYGGQPFLLSLYPLLLFHL